MYTGVPQAVNAVFAVEKYYGLVIISALVLLLQCFCFGYFLVGHYRKRIFNKKFMEAEFGQLHMDATQQQIREGGYPDMGNGLYSQRLDYNSWLIFNKVQRIHHNFLESLAISVILLLIGGLLFPITSAVFGFIQVFARFLSISYISSKGASHFLRATGSVLCFFSTVTTFVFSFMMAARVLSP